MTFASPVAIAANTVYVASYYAPSADTPTTALLRDRGRGQRTLHALADGVGGGDGVYVYGRRDVPDRVVPIDQLLGRRRLHHPGTTPPTVTGQTPAPNATERTRDHGGDGDLQRAWCRPRDDLLRAHRIRRSHRPGDRHLQHGDQHRDPHTHRHLAYSTRPTRSTVSGGTDTSGNLMAAPSPGPSPPAGSSTSTIWSNTVTPANPSANDTGAVELGVKFRSDVAGYITGIRFYKGAATPARTSATSGPSPARCWPRPPSPARRPPAGSR